MSMNVIQLIVHDLGCDLGCYARPVVTPHVDRLATQGARFTGVHASAVCCSPSRACALSGRFPQQNGVMGLAHRGWAMPSSTRTLIDWCNDANIQTVHAGFQHERASAGDNRYAVELSRQREDNLCQNAIDAAIDFLRSRRDPSESFYLNVGTLETHPSAWGESEGADDLKRTQKQRYAKHAPRSGRVAEGATAGLDYPTDYLAAISFLDHHVGRLIDAVDQLGLTNDTLVIFSVDHGAAFGPRAKSTLYTRGTETALIMRAPDHIDPGRVITNLIGNVSLAPTIAEAMGVTYPDDLDGRSFWPLATGSKQADDAILSFRNHHAGKDDVAPACLRRSLRTSDRLLIWHPGKDQLPAPSLSPQALELFDLTRDPHSTRDISGDARHSAELNRLAKDLHARLVACGDLQPDGQATVQADD